MTAWEPCKDCGGARVQGEHCLAHLSDSEWEQEITRLRQGGGLDARGVEISAELLQAVLDALRTDEDRPSLPTLNFDGARFSGDASFEGAEFSGDASFEGAEFSGYTRFEGARFSGYTRFVEARFSGHAIFAGAQFFGVVARFARARFSGVARFGLARFSGDASFEGAEFSGGARFEGARFSGDASFGGVRFSVNSFGDLGGALGAALFERAEFSGGAIFSVAQFSGPASFRRAQFSDVATFSGAQFSGPATFYGAQFSGDAGFAEAQFSGDAIFARAVFRQRITVGPVVVAGTLDFDGADSEQAMRLDASVSRLSCKGTRFGGRADLNVRWAEIALDDAAFVQRSRLAGVSPFERVTYPFGGVDDTPARQSRGDARLDADPRPRLLSVRQADVENLALGNLDLRSCRFFGAHGLDQLRIEADCDFAQPPQGWRYTRRQTLAEEQQWRADRRGEHGWYPPECQPASWHSPEAEAEAQVLDAPQIASLYRALRKALEDRKDEPGAADFYYGEMEMRRHGTIQAIHRWSRLTGERVLLWLYWLVSGYGLRASRALLALVLVIAPAAVPLSLWGFHPRGPYHGYGRSLLFALDSSISLLRAPTVALTAGGQIIEIFLRLAGPLFFGLALLSIRGRVKR